MAVFSRDVASPSFLTCARFMAFVVFSVSLVGLSTKALAPPVPAPFTAPTSFLQVSYPNNRDAAGNVTNFITIPHPNGAVDGGGTPLVYNVQQYDPPVALNVPFGPGPEATFEHLRIAINTPDPATATPAEIAQHNAAIAFFDSITEPVCAAAAAWPLTGAPAYVAPEPPFLVPPVPATAPTGASCTDPTDPGGQLVVNEITRVLARLQAPGSENGPDRVQNAVAFIDSMLAEITATQPATETPLTNITLLGQFQDALFAGTPDGGVFFENWGYHVRLVNPNPVSVAQPAPPAAPVEDPNPYIDEYDYSTTPPTLVRPIYTGQNLLVDFLTSAASGGSVASSPYPSAAYYTLWRAVEADGVDVTDGVFTANGSTAILSAIMTYPRAAVEPGQINGQDTLVATSWQTCMGTLGNPYTLYTTFTSSGAAAGAREICSFNKAKGFLSTIQSSLTIPESDWRNLVDTFSGTGRTYNPGAWTPNSLNHGGAGDGRAMTIPVPFNPGTPSAPPTIPPENEDDPMLAHETILVAFMGPAASARDPASGTYGTTTPGTTAPPVDVNTGNALLSNLSGSKVQCFLSVYLDGAASPCHLAIAGAPPPIAARDASLPDSHIGQKGVIFLDGLAPALSWVPPTGNAAASASAPGAVGGYPLDPNNTGHAGATTAMPMEPNPQTAPLLTEPSCYHDDPPSSDTSTYLPLTGDSDFVPPPCDYWTWHQRNPSSWSYGSPDPSGNNDRGGHDLAFVENWEAGQQFNQFIAPWVRESFIPALKGLTMQLHASIIAQTRMIGAGLDSISAARTRVEMQERELKAKQDFIPSENACSVASSGIGTSHARLISSFVRDSFRRDMKRRSSMGISSRL